MPKVTIQFEEVVTYTAVIETDLTPEQLLEDTEEGWFELMEEQHPEWPKGATVEIVVNERELLDAKLGDD